MPATTTSETESILLSKTVSIAPLVLLSVVDHYNRTAKDTKKRVVGVLLGDNTGSIIRVANSFAVPFEEDERNPLVWFLDHNYIEAMTDMFKKINAKEKLIGWYHSGPKLRVSDLLINDLFKRYTPNPLLVIVDVQPKDVGIPTDAYHAIEEIKDDGTATSKTFVHIPSIIEAEEAEEIGVEHLLRDVRDQAAGSLSTRITNQLSALQGLHHRLHDIANYLHKVLDGTLPINHVILGRLQDVFNLLPNLFTPTDIPDLVKTTKATNHSEVESSVLSRAFTVKTNDELMIVYISCLVRAIIAFHDLIENKIQNKKEAFENSKAEEQETLEAEEAEEEDVKDDAEPDNKK